MTNNEIYDVLTIDAVSRQLGITPRTLRYYEEVGLISPALRTNGGHRLYDQSTMDRIKQILRLKEYLGISLQEIQEVMDAEESLNEIRRTFQENIESADGQRVLVRQYIDVLHNLIEKMNTKIENVEIMRNLYQEQVERSLHFMDELEKK
ncbi:MerR family transcriptional regulator [Neobacillus drentensis]|uniref:helix-turn-helix domain-containing protein n=1 Tax=Neobacillus drentensis TaxID=220684 RepID=UPI001F440750|nr:MerR family transcriptional regulator [Neobacillus drentensis]ULT55041.1 MerR family transcriptional regulator [Neobacillus drentensis]